LDNWDNDYGIQQWEKIYRDTNGGKNHRDTNTMLGGSIATLMMGGSIGILMLVGSSGNQVRRNTIANITLGGSGKPILGISIDNPTFRRLKQVPIILDEAEFIFVLQKL
jgi:hypothetical protein